MRSCKVFYGEQLAGRLVENDEGYQFTYEGNYLQNAEARPVSLTLPLSERPYTSNILFPFFDGLIPEGWLLDITVEVWKIDPRDRMKLLMTCCRDCIGAVSIIPENNDDR